MSKDYRTVPHENGWAVQRDGTSRPTSIHPTQTQAWQETRERAKQSKGEAYLHGQNGQIRERNTYGSDPHPPKG